MISKANVRYFLLLTLLADLVCLSAATAQSKTIPTTRSGARWQEAGLPFIQNFDSKEYSASPQNVMVVRDHRGVMYFANISGVLEYDGVSWRLITLPNSAAVFSLGIDENGVVYVGAEVELGYLAPDSLGQMEYVSLVQRLPGEYRDFRSMPAIIATTHGVHFCGYRFIFRLENFQVRHDHGALSTANTGRFRVIEAKSQFQLAFGVGDKIYVRQEGIGLMKLAGDSLVLVPDGQRFKNTPIQVMLPFPIPDGYAQASRGKGHNKSKHRILVGDRRSELFLYDGVSFQPFKTDADVFLRENHLSRGTNLPDGTIALATHYGGVALIDQQGRLRQIINKAAGLRHEKVNGIYTDPVSGALWVALDNGLARVNMPIPLSLYGEKLGISNSVRSIHRFQGRIYAATHQGIYYLSNPTTRSTYPTFQPVAGIKGYCGEMLVAENTLLAATTIRCLPN